MIGYNLSRKNIKTYWNEKIFVAVFKNKKQAENYCMNIKKNFGYKPNLFILNEYEVVIPQGLKKINTKVKK